MQLSLKPKELCNYICNQLNSFFMDNDSISQKQLMTAINDSLERLEFCFSNINNKYFFNGNVSTFNHLNGDQYAMFLYFLSNTVYLHRKSSSECSVASKIYLLNKALHGIDAFYEVELPKIFLFIHPLGTVLGRASYSDYMVVYQRCGIGTNNESSPRIGKYLTLHPGSSILGDSNIGDNCSIASDSVLIDTDLKNNSVYLGNPSKYKLRANEQYNKSWLFN